MDSTKLKLEEAKTTRTMSLGRERSSVFRIQWRQNIRIWIVKVTQSQNKTWPQEFKVSKQNIVTRICMLCAGIWRLGHENFFWRLFCVTCVCMCEQKRISLERIKERRMRCGETVKFDLFCIFVGKKKFMNNVPDLWGAYRFKCICNA